MRFCLWAILLWTHLVAIPGASLVAPTQTPDLLTQSAVAFPFEAAETLSPHTPTVSTPVARIDGNPRQAIESVVKKARGVLVTDGNDAPFYPLLSLTQTSKQPGIGSLLAAFAFSHETSHSRSDTLPSSPRAPPTS